MKSETPIVESIVAALVAQNIWCWRQNAGKVQARGGWFYGAPAGTPDVIGELHGRLFGIEVKTAKGKARESQIAWADKATRRGVFVGTARTPGEALALIRKWEDSLQVF